MLRDISGVCFWMKYEGVLGKAYLCGYVDIFVSNHYLQVGTLNVNVVCDLYCLYQENVFFFFN